MKNTTDVEQSERLREILPIESADYTWKRTAIPGAKLYMPGKLQYIIDTIPFCFFSGIGLPAWSLTALIKIVPEFSLKKTKNKYTCGNYNSGYWIECSDEYDNPIDAAVELIEKLNKRGLL